MSESETQVAERATTDVAPNNVTNMFEVLQRAAGDPNVDPDKIERLYEIMDRERNSEAKRAWNAAMVAALKEMEPMRRDKKGEKAWYTELASIAHKVSDIFTKNGLFLSFSQGDSPLENHIRVLGDVGHELGHTEQRHVDIPIVDKALQKDGTEKKIFTDIHAVGSAFTYGRRYLTLLLGNIPTPDDDGKAAGGSVVEYITEEQAAKIQEYFDAADDVKWTSKCLEWMGVKELSELQAKDFNKALSGIKKAYEGREGSLAGDVDE